MPRVNFMIDIETLSTSPNASILTIAVVKFARGGPLEKLEKMEKFYVRVSTESCRELNMHEDEDTKKWWDNQDKSIRWEAMENPEERVSIHEALQKLTNFIGSCEAIVWGNGDDFDCVILNQAYQTCGLVTPWKFWNTRDVRTVFDLGGVTPWSLPDNQKHHPIHDCYRQIIGLKRAFKNINLYT